MTGSQQAADKEKVAAIMLAKQKAGKFYPPPLPLCFYENVSNKLLQLRRRRLLPPPLVARSKERHSASFCDLSCSSCATGEKLEYCAF